MKWFRTKCKKPKLYLKAIAFGYVPWGSGCVEVFYNLYENESGIRSYEKFKGREHLSVPDDIDFSIASRVEGWVNDGALPRSLLD